ncbi:Aspartic proteinase nepenthesin [Quillaja saponaria]|uniref:Aspartic proteinase nepenthesin n=1 Tax=Quillaja saponaria TaxID=32244 RepID=A0AAD7Q266_QUISA|nr:Aspartic proteinase nepenthesin [Quillaja saponaria]
MAKRTFSDQSMAYGSFLSLLIHILIVFMAIETIGFKMKLIPRYSIDTELFPKNLTLEEKHHRIVQLSRARALHFSSKISAAAINSTKGTSGEIPDTLQPRIQRMLTSLYVAQINVGPRPYTPYLLLDTGSDDTWFQCEGCINCFPLAGGNYNYHESRKYRVLSCDHPLCLPKICARELCVYNWMYAGGQLTSGFLSTDNFTFPDNEGFVSFENVIFGCGFDSKNIMFGGPLGPNNVIAGLLALGAGKRSILKLLEPATQLRFSYCLQSWITDESVRTYLRFGPDAQISAQAQTTLMVPAGLPRYYVSCVGISIAGARLQIDPSLFEMKPDRSGGFAIDSGTGQTFLIKDVFVTVAYSVFRYFQQYQMNPISGERLPYNLCYRNPPSENFAKPSMTYHFQGADLELDDRRVFQNFDDRNMFCLVILPSSDKEGPSCIFGAFQQTDFRFLFDVRANAISFVPEICNNN